jgi:hypothetical protein
MAVVAKKLAQSALSTSASAIYTAPVLTTGFVAEIWIANTNASTARIVTIYTHGTAAGNTIVPGLSIPASDFRNIGDIKVVLAAGESLAAKQDTGTDVIITIYGVEET